MKSTRIVTTRAQREALYRLFLRQFDWPANHKLPLRDYRRFRKGFRLAGCCGDYYLFGPFAGMFVGIEADGYTHC